MKKIIKIGSLALLAFIAVCGISYMTDTTAYTNWEIVKEPGDSNTIAWTTFEWTSGELSGQHFDKLSMNIPCKIDGYTNTFTFQFDLGASFTGVYENTFSSLFTQHPAAANSIKRLKSRLQFWNGNRYFENFNLHFGKYTAINKIAHIFEGYGEKIAAFNNNDTIHLGTIGADLFKNKVLLIDYPNMQFAIADHIPNEYKNNLVDIETDKSGRVILPMKMRNKNYRIMFDNGSSIFPIITRAENISTYSTLPDMDTIQISSWGKVHGVTGKLITDTFELAGQKFSHVKVYANHSGLGIDKETDAMAGNALFWNKTIIIDFKNKKFGVK